MRFILQTLFAATLLCSCDSNELNREEAFAIIKRDLNYPKTVDYYLFCGDPKHAGNLLEAGLEAKGLVTVKRTVKLRDFGKEPIIQFTEKAKPYLLPTSEEDKKYKIQKVKLAEEDIIEVTGIHRMEDGKTAIAEYKVGYKEITEFSSLIPEKDYTQQATKRAYLALYDDGWRLQKRRP